MLALIFALVLAAASVLTVRKLRPGKDNNIPYIAAGIVSIAVAFLASIPIAASQDFDTVESTSSSTLVIEEITGDRSVSIPTIDGGTETRTVDEVVVSKDVTQPLLTSKQTCGVRGQWVNFIGANGCVERLTLTKPAG